MSALRDRIAIVLVCALSILLAVLLVRPSGKPVSSIAAAPAPQAAAAAPAPRIAAGGSLWEKPNPVPDALRDPMQYKPGRADDSSRKEEAQREVNEGPLGTSGGLPIAGIVYSENEPSVIAGGKIYREGEVVRGTTIVKITRQSVELEKNGERWTVVVRPEPTRK